MLDTHKNHPSDSVGHPSPPKRLIDSYNNSCFAYFLRVIEPFSIFLAVIGLFVTANEIKETRKVREVELLSILLERIDVAREFDSGKDSTHTLIGENPTESRRIRYCQGADKTLNARAGQVSTLERMNNLGISLSELEGYNLNLSRRSSPGLRGIQLRDAKLRAAILSKSNLAKANLNGANLHSAHLSNSCLREANLSNANLTDAHVGWSVLSDADLSGATLVRTNLSHANLSKANFSNATLKDVNLSGAYLPSATIDQSQLDQACENQNPYEERPLVPKHLIWKKRKCPDPPLPSIKSLNGPANWWRQQYASP